MPFADSNRNVAVTSGQRRMQGIRFGSLGLIPADPLGVRQAEDAGAFNFKSPLPCMDADRNAVVACGQQESLGLLIFDSHHHYSRILCTRGQLELLGQLIFDSNDHLRILCTIVQPGSGGTARGINF